MVYLEYNPNEGNHVEVIHSENPINIGVGNLVATSDSFKVNDEFEYYIIVNSVDENGNVTSHASIRQAPQASYLLQKLVEKDVEIVKLKADLDYLSIMTGVDLSV